MDEFREEQRCPACGMPLDIRQRVDAGVIVSTIYECTGGECTFQDVVWYGAPETAERRRSDPRRSQPI
jgi:hypothetical protein